MSKEDFPESVVVPILNEELGVLTVVAPKDWINKMELHALKIIEAFDQHPAGSMMDKNNQMMQAMSFLIQNAGNEYLYHNEDVIPPDVV